MSAANHGTDPSPEPDKTSSADSETPTAEGSAAGSDPGPGSQPGPRAEPGPGSGPAAASEPGAASGAGPGAGPMPGQASEPGPQPEPGSEAEPDPAAEAGAETELAELSVEDLVGDLERVTAERDQYLDLSRRLQAEMENFRKTMTKREADSRQRANEALVASLLPVLDACDAAVTSGATDVEPVQANLFEVLGKEGLSRIDKSGTPFDPSQHDAVLHEPADGEDGPMVAEVMRPGYSWKGRVVRPAMVRVRG